MLRALTNDDRYIEMLAALTEEEKKGEIIMCELLDKYENRGIKKEYKKECRKECRKECSRERLALHPLLKNCCSQTVWRSFKKLLAIRNIENGYMKSSVSYRNIDNTLVF